MTRIVPGRKYSLAEMQVLRNDPELESRELAGYVMRHNADGTTQFIHASQASGGGGKFQGTQDFEGRLFTKPTNFGPLPEIKKRTPTERVDSLMARFIDDCKRTGTVPGLDDPRISAILGQTINTDRNGITAEEIRLLAQRFLEKAEKEKQEHDSRFVTTPSPND